METNSVPLFDGMAQMSIKTLNFFAHNYFSKFVMLDLEALNKGNANGKNTIR